LKNNTYWIPLYRLNFKSSPKKYLEKLKEKDKKYKNNLKLTDKTKYLKAKKEDIIPKIILKSYVRFLSFLY
jgi:hypothetical protein